MPEPAKGFQLKIYNINKRRNSTKRPNDKWFYEDANGDLYLSAFCTFKHEVDLYEPIVLLAVDREDESSEGSGEYDSYWLMKCNYAQLLGRYYWIKKLVSVRRDHWEVHLQADPLATYKNWIGDTKVFAEYWGAGNYELIDTRLPRQTDGGSSGMPLGPLFEEGNMYVVGIITENGFVYYDLQSYNNLQRLLGASQKWFDMVWNAMMRGQPSDPEVVEPEEKTIEEIVKALTETFGNCMVYLKDVFKWSFQAIWQWIQNGFSKDKIASMMTVAMYYPFKLPILGGTAENITIGNFETDIPGIKIPYLTYRNQIQYQVPQSVMPFDAYQAAWGRRAQFCSWTLYVPYFGAIQVPSDLIVAGTSIIEIQINGNIGSGAAHFRVCLKGFADATTSFTLGNGTVKLAGEIATGMASSNMSNSLGSIAGAAAGVAVASIGGNIGGTRGLLMQMSGATSAANNAMHFADSVQPVGTQISGASGGVKLSGETPEGQVTIIRYNFDVSEQEVNLEKVIGVPKFGVCTVAEAGGYVKCNGASFSCRGASADEIDIVNNCLNSGMYYE